MDQSGQVQSEALPAATPVPSVLVSSATSNPIEGEVVAPSRKRPGSPASLSPTLRKIASAGLDKSRRSSSPKLGKQPHVMPPLMTAAAAMHEDAEERRANQNKEAMPSTSTSPNPANQALGALMGLSSAAQTNSSISQAPMSEALKTVAQSIQIPNSNNNGDSQTQTSPASLSSFGTLASSTAATAPPVSSPVESPGSMEDVVQVAMAEMHDATAGDVSPEDGNKAFSYPGPSLPQQIAESQRRGMSLPQSASRQAGSRSPSAKKHRCPYCATEFTRHHNLKSHLLTHSQEKPYVCQTCQSRFRRLHDLKRHSKLHTGERPHICPKCGRRFARGDALARHNKGPGGCAGRRSSVGSFGGDDSFAEGSEEPMDGLVYQEPSQIGDNEDGEPRPGMPSIRKHEAPNEPSAEKVTSPSFLSRQPSTYPPIQGRPATSVAGGLFPPPGHGGSTPSSTSPVSQSGTLPFPPAPTGSMSHNVTQAGSHVFSQGGITESPKPLSPGSGGAPPHPHTENSIYRNRSPSGTTPFQQQYSRGSGRRTPPPSVGGGSLPLPPGLAPQLPPPHQLNPPDSRYTLPSQGPAHPPTGPTGPPTHMSGGGLSSQSNSLSSHAASHHGSGEGSGTAYPQVGREERLWAYVKSLEDRLNGLQEEVTSLKAQLSIASQPKQR